MLGSHFEHQIGDVLVALHGREELLPVAEHFRGVREPCKARILLSVLVSVMTPCLRNFLPHSRNQKFGTSTPLVIQYATTGSFTGGAEGLLASVTAATNWLDAMVSPPR